MSQSGDEGFEPHPGDPWHPEWNDELEDEGVAPARAAEPPKKEKRKSRRRRRQEEREAAASVWDESEGEEWTEDSLDGVAFAPPEAEAEAVGAVEPEPDPQQGPLGAPTEDTSEIDAQPEPLTPPEPEPKGRRARRKRRRAEEAAAAADGQDEEQDGEWPALDGPDLDELTLEEPALDAPAWTDPESSQDLDDLEAVADAGLPSEAAARAVEPLDDLTAEEDLEDWATYVESEEPGDKRGLFGRRGRKQAEPEVPEADQPYAPPGEDILPAEVEPVTEPAEPAPVADDFDPGVLDLPGEVPEVEVLGAAPAVDDPPALDDLPDLDDLPLDDGPIDLQLPDEPVADDPTRQVDMPDPLAVEPEPAAIDDLVADLLEPLAEDPTPAVEEVPAVEPSPAVEDVSPVTDDLAPDIEPAPEVAAVMPVVPAEPEPEAAEPAAAAGDTAPLPAEPPEEVAAAEDAEWEGGGALPRSWFAEVDEDEVKPPPGDLPEVEWGEGSAPTAAEATLDDAGAGLLDAAADLPDLPDEEPSLLTDAEPEPTASEPEPDGQPEGEAESAAPPEFEEAAPEPEGTAFDPAAFVADLPAAPLSERGPDDAPAEEPAALEPAEESEPAEEPEHLDQVEPTDPVETLPMSPAELFDVEPVLEGPPPRPTPAEASTESEDEVLQAPDLETPEPEEDLFSAPTEHGDGEDTMPYEPVLPGDDLYAGLAALGEGEGEGEDGEDAFDPYGLVEQPGEGPEVPEGLGSGAYSGAVTMEHRDLADEIARYDTEETELQALTAPMEGLDSSVVGFEDVEDLGSGEEYVAPARSDFGMRIVTGFVLAGLLLGTLFVGSEALAIFIGAMLMVGLAEFYGTLRLRGHQPLTLFGLLAGAGMLVTTWFYGPIAIPGAILALTVVVFFFYAVVPTRRDALTNGGLTILGVAWVTGTAAFVLPIIDNPEFRVLVLGVAAATVAMDVGAYAFGRAWGSSPMAPILSPNKSIEGLAGGVVMAIGAAVAIGYFFEPLNIRVGAALGLVVAVLAPLGDLAESMIKRSIGVKDMGAILPGHGGILDRIDAFLFVLPAAWVLYATTGLLG